MSFLKEVIIGGFIINAVYSLISMGHSFFISGIFLIVNIILVIFVKKSNIIK